MKNKTIVSLFALVLYVSLQSNYICTRPSMVVTIDRLLQRENAGAHKVEAALAKPGKLSATLLKYGFETPANVGIFATYMGYLAPTDWTGVIQFPRHTVQPQVRYLITPNIKPIMMLGNTVHHWVIEPNTPAALYHFSRVQDEVSQQYYWNVQPETVDYNSPIGLDTVVIFAQPKYIIVPTGRSSTEKNPNLVLPTIFAKRGINHTANALRVLTIRHLFGPLIFEKKEENQTHYSRLLAS